MDHSNTAYCCIIKYQNIECYTAHDQLHILIKELKSKPPQVSVAYYFQKMYYLVVCLCACVYRGQKGESEPSTSVTGVFILLNVQGAKLRASGRALRPLSYWATSPSLMRCILRDGKQCKLETHFWKGNHRNLIRSTCACRGKWGCLENLQGKVTDLMDRAATEWSRFIYVSSETETEAQALLCTVSDKLAQLIQLSGLILHFWTRHILHCFRSQVLFLGIE